MLFCFKTNRWTKSFNTFQLHGVTQLRIKIPYHSLLDYTQSDPHTPFKFFCVSSLFHVCSGHVGHLSVSHFCQFLFHLNACLIILFLSEKNLYPVDLRLKYIPQKPFPNHDEWPNHSLLYYSTTTYHLSTSSFNTILYTHQYWYLLSCNIIALKRRAKKHI